PDPARITVEHDDLVALGPPLQSPSSRRFLDEDLDHTAELAAIDLELNRTLKIDQVFQPRLCDPLIHELLAWKAGRRSTVARRVPVHERVVETDTPHQIEGGPVLLVRLV